MEDRETLHEDSGQQSGRTRSFLYLLVLLFLTWLVLTSSLHWHELLVGVVVSVLLALFLNKTYLGLGMPPLSIKRIWFMISYLVVLGVEIIKANLDVAWRIIHPKLPINPGIVIIKTDLRQDIAKMILANSITLTPGTFTLDIIGSELLIHWIDVKSEDTEEATRLVGERFERYLRVIFE
ncbi:Na+/H+ antiporter subunit E [Candidatus Fermentibacteria bacterium]|nr:Na+/H+ antiporter subunit E [Candidatus Fermentibacteria bacterium]